MTDACQFPHQDTPPYPTAFWLDKPRCYFATWVISLQGLHAWNDYNRQHPQLSIEEVHCEMVPQSLSDGTGLLFNQNAGLLLIDNSNHHQLFHARTCNFAAIASNPDYQHDAPMYAFNEVGLLEYIDSLDIYRGTNDRNAEEVEAVRKFMASEKF